MITALSSALVLAVTGVAWSLYRDVTAGITTTDIIAGGWSGGAQNILLVGVDSRTDAQGKPLPPAVLSQLHSGPDTGVINSDTIMLLHVPADGGAAVAFSIPRDSYVDIPGYRRDKINAAYPAKKAEAAEQLVGRRGARSGPGARPESAEAGRRALVGAVEELTGLTVDHYAEINLVGFHSLTSPSAASTSASRPRSTIRCPAPGSRRTADDLRRRGAGVRPAAARPARRRPVPDPAPAGLPGRRRRQDPLRRAPSPTRPSSPG